ncbi:MAG: hypothetical protein KF774_12025 [Planctomyces sp.]|nr:hypothetical protein [Planctomyces sp.]
MNKLSRLRTVLRTSDDAPRRGGFMVLAAFCLIAALAFVSLCVDVGYLSLSKQRLQNAVDAAALAAAMEITNAVQTAGADVQNVTAYAESQARIKAVEVGALNGVYIDGNRDVAFGQRQVVDGNGNFQTTWGASPANVVKVTARRDNNDMAAPDSKLTLFFAGILGDKTASLTASAAAYVESRDIVCVLDYSGSMNDDSGYFSLGIRDRTLMEANMLDIWNILSGLRNTGALQFEPQWMSTTVNGSNSSGTVTFRNTQADLSTNKNITSVRLTFSDGSTQTTNYSNASNIRSLSNLERSSNPKRTINEVRATVTYPGYGTVQSASGSNSSRTANITFNGQSVSVSTSHTMASIRLNYAPSGNQTFSASGTSRTQSGNGSYISSVVVTMGTTSVTVNNPNGSTQPNDTQILTFSDSVANVRSCFSLNGSWPWSGGSWNDFIAYCRKESPYTSDTQITDAGYFRQYGGKCLVNYLQEKRAAFNQCNDLWRTPHYPFHSMKQGVQLFADFLEDLNFGDEMGLVCYATTAQVEHTLNYDGYNINLSANPICDQFQDMKQIIGHRQANHYTNTTNIGGGLKLGKELLDSSKRPGTRPTILLMTDGLANVRDNSYSLPGNWNWNELFDYDGDGTADYTTNDSFCRYALGMAKEAVDAGYTIHTLSVGAGADTNLMRAIAWLGRGIYIEVPGDVSVAEMEEQVLEAFNRIAAFVPPAKLVSEVE